MRTLVTLIQIIVAMLAILALVLWEKRDKYTNWLLSLCLLIPMLIIPQIFEDSDNYAMCMRTDDETKGGIPSYIRMVSMTKISSSSNVFRTRYHTTNR